MELYPPRIARCLARWCLHPVDQGAMLGDLEETFAEIAMRYGPHEAKRWYWSQVLRSVPLFCKRLLYWSHVMLAHYLKVALRTLGRNKGYTFINVVGLALGLACCILIVLFIQDEQQYDRFHEKGDHIYRVVTSTSDSGEPTNANGTFPVGPNLKRDFPEVAEAVRFRTMGVGTEVLVRQGTKRFYEPRFYFADSSVFDVFSFPLLQGEAQTALTRPKTLVLTETSARRYFGTLNPVGQILEADPYNSGTFMRFEVTGVMRDVPAQSHIQFDFLASFTSQTDESGWGNFQRVYTYVLLAPGAEAIALEAKLFDFLDSHVDEGNRWYNLALQPLTDIHLHSQLRSELEANGNSAYIFLFSAVAVFILLIAGINFINLTTARSTRRAKEVGMRKVAGAHKGQLIGQFLGEALLLSGIAVALALSLVTVLLPYFNALADKALAPDDVFTTWLVGGILGIGLIIGLLAGAYPAFVLASYRPAGILKGQLHKGRSGSRLRQSLVVFQFATSIILMACTAIAYHQLAFVRTTDVGFDREQVLVLPLNHELRSQYEAFSSELERHPQILEASGTSLVPSRGSNMFLYRVEGSEKQWGFHTYFVDYGFTETMGVRLSAGRAFDPAQPTDAQTAFIVNETSLPSYGWTNPEEALGKTFQGLGREGTIVGVMEDVHIYSLHRKVLPMVLMVTPDEHFRYLTVRINTEGLAETLAHVETVAGQFQDTYPFTYFFLDEAFEQMHRADLQLTQVLQAFAGLAILIACLGLFGLATFTAEQRVKEIGVRKVLGASVSGLVGMLSKDVFVLVTVAFVVAIPLAYVAMDAWLQRFAYRIDLGMGVFVLVGGLALLIAWLTVAYQAIRAAHINPVDALRYE